MLRQMLVKLLSGRMEGRNQNDSVPEAPELSPCASW